MKRLSISLITLATTILLINGGPHGSEKVNGGVLGTNRVNVINTDSVVFQTVVFVYL